MTASAFGPTWGDRLTATLGHRANLMLATGHGMLGVTMSAATGVLISELLCGKAPSLDPTPYRPERF